MKITQLTEMTPTSPPRVDAARAGSARNHIHAPKKMIDSANIGQAVRSSQAMARREMVACSELMRSSWHRVDAE